MSGADRYEVYAAYCGKKYCKKPKKTITKKGVASATIKKGKTWKVKASVALVDPSKKILSDKHAPTFRYASSNKKVATVNKSGKVTAKKKGTCVIYVYAKNGYAKKVRITVK